MKGNASRDQQHLCLAQKNEKTIAQAYTKKKIIVVDEKMMISNYRRYNLSQMEIRDFFACLTSHVISFQFSVAKIRNINCTKLECEKKEGR